MRGNLLIEDTRERQRQLRKDLSILKAQLAEAQKYVATARSLDDGPNYMLYTERVNEFEMQKSELAYELECLKRGY